MLTEFKEVRQIEGEGTRRWFKDEYFDLIVWYDDNSKLEGFQLCYDKMRNERALTWRRGDSYVHNRVDNGELTGEFKRTPVLVSDGAFDTDSINSRFEKAAIGINGEIAEFVSEKISNYK